MLQKKKKATKDTKKGKRSCLKVSFYAISLYVLVNNDVHNVKQ